MSLSIFSTKKIFELGPTATKSKPIRHATRNVKGVANHDSTSLTGTKRSPRNDLKQNSSVNRERLDFPTSARAYRNPLSQRYIYL